MKHLRVFETFKKEDYYVTTSREEYQNFELVSMSEENAIKIKNIVV